MFSTSEKHDKKSCNREKYYTISESRYRSANNQTNRSKHKSL